MEPLFTQYKQYVQFKVSGQTVGDFFERVSGGGVEYAVAEAAPANSVGRIYRATRYRIEPVSLEGYLRRDTYARISAVMGQFKANRRIKDLLTISRTIIGEGNLAASENKIVEEFDQLTIIQPFQAEDGDVGRDTDFVMATMRFQPEIKRKFINGSTTPIEVYDATELLSSLPNG